jgi:hypothetical protein
VAVVCLVCLLETTRENNKKTKTVLFIVLIRDIALFSTYHSRFDFRFVLDYGLRPFSDLGHSIF